MDLSSLTRFDRVRILAELDMAAVASVLGVDTDTNGTASCPFHQDDTPSFAIFTGDDGKQRGYCHGCSWRGDVIDFVREREGLDYGGALARCAELLAGGLPAPTPRSTEPVDFHARVQQAQTDAAAGVPEPIRRLLAERDSPIEPRWLVEHFRLGVEGDTILMPHYGVGEDRPLGVKKRGPGGKSSLKGSRLTHLYGAWRDRRRTSVIICEGESDTWTLAWHLRDEPVDVLGLPRGVGSQVDDEWLAQLKGRAVTLIFDADTAGRRGAQRWATVLNGVALEIRMAHLPEGADVSSVPVETLEAALTAATVVPDPERLPVWRGRASYLRRPTLAQAAQGQGDTPISDWTVEILRRVVVPGERIVYEVRLPNGSEASIAQTDIGTTAKLVEWSNRHGHAYVGRGVDAQHLLRLFEYEALFVPRLRGEKLVGWADGCFVLPGETIGPPGAAYVTVTEVGWGERLALGAGSPDPEVPILLASLHDPAVMTPILGWMAAAPLRALCQEFPTLAVMGSAGAGKTTLVQETLITFGFSKGVPQTASSTTPYALDAVLDSTNAIPVWIDEYRLGAKTDTIFRLDQKIRDAWNGSSSMRGGVGENKLSLQTTRALAPIIVTGESAFTETSHAERMAIVSLPPTGRNRGALEMLRGSRRAGFGRGYLEWLVAAHAASELEAPPVRTDRMEQTRAVIAWGYRLLRQYARVDLPELDLSLVSSEQQGMAETPPIIEAMREFHNAIDRVSGAHVVWCERNDVCVRFGRLTKLASSETTIVLPGNERAVLKWLEERFPDAYQVRQNGGRYLVLPNAREAVFGPSV